MIIDDKAFLTCKEGFKNVRTIKDGIDFVTIFRLSARNIGCVDTIIMISFPL